MRLVQGPHSEDKGVEELVSYIPLVSKAFSQGNFGAFPPCSFLSALTNGILEPSLENKAGEKELQESKNMERRRQWHPTPVLLPGESHGWRSLVGCGPWGRTELDMTEVT